MTATPRETAMVEFVGTFETLSGNPPETLADLSDGVHLFEALSELAPDFFDPTTMARHLGDNWALKSSNLRKLLRNLQDYYHEALQKDADFAAVNVSAVAKRADADGIAALVELVAAAAVTCEEKTKYVQRIMTGLSGESQVQMKFILEDSLARLDDYDTSQTPGLDDDDEHQGGDDDDDEDNELVFDNDAGTGGPKEDDDNKGSGNLFSSHVAEGLEQELEEARREIASLKSQASLTADDNVRAEQTLRTVVQDLQDRLSARQEDLVHAESDLQTAQSQVDELRSKLREAEDSKSQLADDLDVANAKTQQLHKAEATVLAYKKKLEGVGAMNQQMTDLEDQAAKYLRQIMQLEAQVKRSAELEKTVASLQEEVASLEREKTVTASSHVSSATEIDTLKERLTAAETAKKMYQEELNELRAASLHHVMDESTSSGGDGGLVAAADREKVARLEIEKEDLLKQVQDLKSQMATTPTTAAAKVATAAAGGAAQVARLEEELAAKNKENAKISSDKDKLENYTKRTLAKFQEKYLVALQECKAKLKEKQDKIDALESRSASERTAQKREERLLSSTIYELGLAIMQNRLKDR